MAEEIGGGIVHVVRHQRLQLRGGELPRGERLRLAGRRPQPARRRIHLEAGTPPGGERERFGLAAVREGVPAEPERAEADRRGGGRATGIPERGLHSQPVAGHHAGLLRHGIRHQTLGQQPSPAQPLHLTLEGIAHQGGIGLDAPAGAAGRAIQRGAPRRLQQLARASQHGAEPRCQRGRQQQPGGVHRRDIVGERGGGLPPRLGAQGGEEGHPRKGGIDSAQEAGGAAPGAVGDQRQPHRRRTKRLQLPHVLGAVQAPGAHRDLVIRLPHRRVEPPPIEGERRGGGIEAGAAVELERGPRGEPLLLRQLGKAGGVSGDAERLLRRPAGGLVLPVAIPRGAAEDRHHHLGPEAADDPHDVLEHRVPGPVRPGVVQILGEAEVVGTGEELAGAVEPPGGKQFLGAEQPQLLSQLLADQVLAALAAIEGEICRLRPHAARQQGEELGVLVVGMGRDEQHPLVVTQAAELLVEGGEPAGGGRRELAGEWSAGGEQQEEREQAAGRHGKQGNPRRPGQKGDPGAAVSARPPGAAACRR